MAKRNKHSLSHYKLLTGDMGQLLPCCLVEILPGDTIQHSTNALVRLTPMAAPVMHPATVRIHHFFVPHRLSWDRTFVDVSFEDFITGGPLGTDATTVPTLGLTANKNDLHDYFGLPKHAEAGLIEVNSMPVRAFNLIYNEFYRDQDLIPERELDLLTIPHISWEKDYFTTSRPWAQKGDAVTLPIGTKAPIIGLGATNQAYDQVDASIYETGGVQRVQASSANTDGTGNLGYVEDTDHAGFPGIYADLSEATGVNINEVRKAFALQRFAEARARYGSRYTEYLRYIGVRSSDARLQRPEYLGGGRVNVSISEVLQTSPEPGAEATDSYVGDLYGHGIAAMRSNRYRRHFQEHGYLLSLLSVRPKAVYSDGIPRHWLRRFREDYYQKELEHIGQQEVWKAEVFADAGDVYETWGYQDRYREYREEPSEATSEFKDVLNYWHMARIFEAAPALNAAFINCIPTKRIFSEQTQHSLWMLVQHSIVARRIVSRNATGRIF